jgi:hypothetical protein
LQKQYEPPKDLPHHLLRLVLQLNKSEDDDSASAARGGTGDAAVNISDGPE